MQYAERFCMPCYQAAKFADRVAHSCYTGGTTGGQLFAYQGQDDPDNVVKGNINVVVAADSCPGNGPPGRRDIDGKVNAASIQPKNIKLEGTLQVNISFSRSISILIANKIQQEVVERAQTIHYNTESGIDRRDENTSLEERQQVNPSQWPNVSLLY